MVTFKEKKILINNKSVFLLSGELHYFRQPNENWESLIKEAGEMGLNCISSYVPWLLHEEVEGEYCFRENLDLGAFIDLCSEFGLSFFVRPGPFIMAEMKKEGIPYWVTKKHPEAVTKGFEGKIKPCNTVDYLHPGYLYECRKWYEEVMKIIVPRLHCNGGNIIGVQLDNEVGMLNWVTNHPTLNDNVLGMMAAWLKSRYSEKELYSRYSFWGSGEEESFAAMRTLKEEDSVSFHYDYGRFMRAYYAGYIQYLKECAEKCGVRDTPFFVNIHGTGEGRIFDYPLGISQLYEAWNQDEGMISGSDVYLGEPTEGKYQDLYVANAYTDAMNKKKNPLTSIEFECGDAPYCSLNGMRYHPSATAHKMLMCLSQNARMLSFYVFSGGENTLLHHPEKDGNERMAFTGQMHGMNAPVQPDGTHSYAFDHIAAAAQPIHALNELIASSKQQLDPVSLALIPDYFLTEAVYEKSASMKKIYENLKRLRCAGQIDHIGRALLGQQIHFDALDIQNEEIGIDKVLVVMSARYMAAEVQNKLIGFVVKGGKLLLYGEIPEYDMEGSPGTLLRDALGLGEPRYIINNPPTGYLTMNACGVCEGNAPMHCGEFAQVFEADDSAILKLYGSGEMCGMKKRLDKGVVCAITADYPVDPGFWKSIFKELGIRPRLSAHYYRQGIYFAQTKSEDGQSLFYLMNLDSADKVVDLMVEEELLFSRFSLGSKQYMILPFQVKAPVAVVERSTAEIIGIEDDAITFRCTQPEDRVIVRTKREPKQGDPESLFNITRTDDLLEIRTSAGAGKILRLDF